MNNGVILVNGVFPTHIIPLTILKKTTKLICCDGAINELDKKKIHPTLIIGDCDSISGKLKNKYKSQILQIDRQTDSDLEKALKYCINEKLNEIIILGFEGYRDDHYLSNIFLCWEYSKFLNVSMNSNYGKFSFVKNQTTFNSFIGQQISIFNKEPNIEIITKRLKYNLNNTDLSNLYSGTSNESLSNTFSIKTNDITIMVYQNYKD